MNRKENILKFSLNGLTPVLDFLHARIVPPTSLIGSVGSIFSLPGLAIAPSVRKSATRGSKPHSSATATTLPRCERGRHSLLLYGDEGTQGSPHLAKVAFTLAEVLITLGIIGVVATMTLPTLIQNYKKHEVETKLAKFYTVMNQAVTRAEAVYGDKKVWGSIGNGFELDENGNPDRTKPIPKAWFDKYLKPYLNIVDEKVSVDGRVLVTFSDGSFAAISSNSIIYYIDKKYYNEILNDNGSGKIDYAHSGTQLFFFAMWPTWKEAIYHYGKGIEPYSNTFTSVDYFKRGSWGGCYEASSYKGMFCAKLIQLNGWKIPKDYPFKF